ncbi:TetR/AcrR family transcriptional regulator [Providencia rustigianii]|uniref:TetR/AcrR family transcriptional regulator n=1 Tax=Providencia rustigianii TaxID=158850 RepID=UPI00223FB81E|nr:TetR/AcrR family transcriptional regulator [Providencia rustigianii]
MARRTQAQMEQTRALLLSTARDYFCRFGYAETSMDELTASVELTRGALYHHFGDKKGLFLAVVEQIDAEMNQRLQEITDNNSDLWHGFQARCHAYLEMALEPEYQQVVLRDAKAVLGEAIAKSNLQCADSIEKILTKLMDDKVIADVNPRALAALLNGSLSESAYWIAQDNSHVRLKQSIAGVDLLLNGLLITR